jgi:hypothetical protein
MEKEIKTRILYAKRIRDSFAHDYNLQYDDMLGQHKFVRLDIVKEIKHVFEPFNHRFEIYLTD